MKKKKKKLLRFTNLQRNIFLGVFSILLYLPNFSVQNHSLLLGQQSGVNLDSICNVFNFVILVTAFVLYFQK